MIVWGVISAATAAVTSFGGLIAVRFFLGFVEAAYFPGCLYYLSCVRHPQPLSPALPRLRIWEPSLFQDILHPGVAIVARGKEEANHGVGYSGTPGRNWASVPLCSTRDL